MFIENIINIALESQEVFNFLYKPYSLKLTRFSLSIIFVFILTSYILFLIYAYTIRYF